MILRSLSCFALIAALSTVSLAQPSSGRQGGGPGGGGRTDDAFAERLMTLDEDKDGGLSIKELPEHMQKHFATSDADKNGQLTGNEIKTLAANFGRDRMRPGGEGGTSGGPGGRGPGGGGGGQGIRGGPGGGAPRTGGGGGPGGGGPGGGGPGGAPPSAADLVNRAFTFDANNDGSLDKDELLKFAEDMIARRGQGRGGPAGGGPGPGGPGPGGPGRGGPGLGGGRGPGGGAPEAGRPRRPTAE